MDDGEGHANNGTKKIAVIDMGVSKFDVTLLKMDNGYFTTLANVTDY